MSAAASDAARCPRCGEDLYNCADVQCVDWVAPINDPEGKARADLILACDCGAKFNAFVPLAEFQPIDDGA